MPTLRLAPKGELGLELPGDEAELGMAMEGKLSLEKLLHGEVGLLVAFSKAVGRTQGSMGDF